jgi:RNA-directed DNA polymerase
MKRIGNLYAQIYSIENLQHADAIARKGKLKQPAIINHDKNREQNINDLHLMLKNKTYKTSKYTTFTVREPKERLIFRLPYFPDRIAHHAVMNVLEKHFVATFTADTYSCIKGRGIHAAKRKVERALKDRENTKYCLKLDIKKFYPSVDHEILKLLLRRKFKDADLLWLLDGVIDSAQGLPIGNYLSQYFANFYLSYFDHWLKEDERVRYYFRYADDIVIFSSNKPYLHEILAKIKYYLAVNLKLKVKRNYQVFPVPIRGVNFAGYKMYDTHTIIRPTIKEAFARMVAGRRNEASINSYLGWFGHCKCRHLVKKILHESV